MSIAVLHLSDIHIKYSNDPILSRAEKIARSVFYMLPDVSDLFVLVSGDVAYSGQDEEYNLALDFFIKIKQNIENEATCKVHFIITPGNHDCNFKKNSSTRNIIIDSINNGEFSSVDESIISTTTSIQGEFFNFRELLEENKDVEDDLLWRSTKITIDNKNITFDCLNVSWLSKIREEVGKLYFPIDKYIEKEKENTDLRIVVIHHPFNWFNQTIYRAFRVFIRKIATIIVSGHEHQSNVGVVEDIESDTSIFIEGGVLQDSDTAEKSSFNLIKVDLESGVYETTILAWNGCLYEIKNSVKKNIGLDSAHLKNDKFYLKSEFQDIIDDPGAFLKHPSQARVSLSDIYVYPDLKKATNDEKKIKKTINSRKLLDFDFVKNGILIEGEEKTGRTSLLYQLYMKYLEKGFIPVLVAGKDLKFNTDNSIDSVINKAFIKQYGEEKLTLISQTSKHKKILLIDDFDDTKIKSNTTQIKLLTEFKKRFSCIVVTVSAMFEMREILDGDGFFYS